MLSFSQFVYISSQFAHGSTEFRHIIQISSLLNLLTSILCYTLQVSAMFAYYMQGQFLIYGYSYLRGWRVDPVSNIFRQLIIFCQKSPILSVLHAKYVVRLYCYPEEINLVRYNKQLVGLQFDLVYLVLSDNTYRYGRI